jgi:uncharacterized membrane protein
MMSKKPESTDWRSIEDRFALARHRYLRGLISDEEFYAAHRELREAKANGN